MELEGYVKAELSQLISGIIPRRGEETEELERKRRENLVWGHEERKKDEELVKMKKTEEKKPTKVGKKKREEMKK
jgi:hypothetical protein